ncbi:hypothetical protein crov362 [Cafeteria roenbergensis virus]|uniref:Uncharacterized protein n=1 Tax=Cafeteria roenbergensis virus (strain BV-PW1) TaxID=693272 RepID=E3T5D3_CROVB|nr:hypothetical protein crov362 [Cafeteria roenbergensis virus BV-PW1]ADO67396.1 hypothetical protein crov362 [Cafeteria roenbergensis virus BV-PW1]
MNQLQGESINEFNTRKQFFVFLTGKKIKDKIKITKIYCNIKYRRCIYSKTLYTFIKKLEEEFINKHD